MARESDYELRKATVNRSAAMEMFSQDFATKAFEECVQKPAVRRSNPDARPRLAPNMLSYIVNEGREQLAIASMAYLIAAQGHYETVEERAFEALIEEIGAGATRIVKAADTLAQQLDRHYLETGKWEPVRYRALSELAAALNAGFFSAEELKPRYTSHLGGSRVRHGLLNCSRLAHHADECLIRFRRGAKNLRKENKKVLTMTTGRPSKIDRNQFVIDLAGIYERGMQRRPSASPDASSNPSPFVRFVDHVFQEVEFVAQGLGIEGEYSTPSASLIRVILEGSRTSK